MADQFDPNAFIVETQMLQKEKKKSKQFDPDDFIAETRQSMQQEESPGVLERVGRFGVGVTQGAAEMINFPALPGAVERMGRAVPKIIGGDRQPGESFLQKIGRSFAESDKEALIPQPTAGETAAGIRTAFQASPPSNPAGLAGFLSSFQDPKEVLKQELDVQEQFSKEFSSPTGEMVGALATIAIPIGAKLGPAISKARGVKQTQKAVKLTKQFLKQGDGPITDVILSKPEKVRSLLESGQFSLDDVAIAIGEKLDEVGSKLGKKVGKFRTSALNNKLPGIEVPDEAIGAFEGIARSTTIDGQSVLPKDMQSKLALLKRVLSKKQLSSEDALKATDLLTDIADYGDSAGPGSNFIKNADFEIKNVRRLVKNELRKSAPDWAAADDAFATFKEESKGLTRKLASDSRESLIDNLLNKNKTPLRTRLSKAMDMADEAGVSSSDNFLTELAARKAAQGIKGVQLEIADPIADNVNRIVRKYAERGEGIGTALGFAGGGALGVPAGGVAGLGGGGFGALAGRALGREVGGLVGKIKADPLRILKAAEKAKELSSPAKSLAKDLTPIAKAFGVDGIDAVFALIPASRAAQELKQFSTQGDK